MPTHYLHGVTPCAEMLACYKSLVDIPVTMAFPAVFVVIFAHDFEALSGRDVS